MFKTVKITKRAIFEREGSDDVKLPFFYFNTAMLCIQLLPGIERHVELLLDRTLRLNG